MPRRERSVGGRGTAAGVAVVHDVVVQEGGRLEEFHGCGESDQGGGVIAATGSETPVEKSGAQPFATREEGGDDVEEIVNVGSEFGEDARLIGEEPIDAGLHPGAQVGQRIETFLRLH